MKANKRVFALLLTFIVVFSLNPFVVKADVIGRWSPDAQVPGYLNDTFTPFLVADRNRTVHAFASQWVVNEYRRLAIVYRRWSLSGGWTRPVDIVLAPTGDAQILGAFLDSTEKMHIIFMSGEGRSTAVYYSNALAVNADLAIAWSPPVIIGWNALGLNSAAIIGDDQENLIVIYSGNRDGGGVYFVTSADAGDSWSEASPVFLTYDTNLVPYSLRLTTGPDRQVRATWNVVTSLGVDEKLYFANYAISNSKWNIPIELDSRIDLPDYFGPSFPAIVDNGSDIVIMYNGGNPLSGRPVNPGRPIQRVSLSGDGGQTWSGPLDPFPFHVGRSGEHALTLDGIGVPHALFIQRIETLDEAGEYVITGGIWHSAFKNGSWTNPDRFVTTYPPHDVRAIISQGNVLLAVWREDPGTGKHGVWFSYTILDIPELPVVPLATVPVEHSSSQQDPIAPPYFDTPEPLPQTDLLDEPLPSSLGMNPALPIIIGVSLGLILIGVVLAYRFLTGRRA